MIVEGLGNVTFVNGVLMYNHGVFNTTAKGKRITKLKVENFWDELSRVHQSPERDSKIIN